MNQIDFTKLKVANYNRKSSEAEDKQMLSIESQVDEAARIVEYHKLSPFIEVFKEAKSAKTEHSRPEFSRMMDMVRKGEIDSIACWKLDRLARNMTEGGQIIDLLSSGTIKAIITHDKVFYPWDNVIVMSVEFSQGKQFVKELSVNVKRGQEKKARMGYPHGMAALGFINDKTEEKGNRKWLVDGKRFAVLKEMFAMFLAGDCSGGQLYDWAINTAKLTTPEHKKSGGCFIAPSRIYELLKDPVYAGFFFNNGQRYELAPELPRIITEAEHYLIRKMLGDRKAPKTQDHLTAYSGFVRSPYGDFVGPDVKLQVICDCKHKFSYANKDACPKCGIALIKMSDPKYLAYSYYYNIRMKKQHLKVRSVEDASITKYLVNYIRKNLQLSPALADWCKRHISEMKERDISSALVAEDARATRIAQLTSRKERSRQYLNDGITSPEDYRKDAEKIEQEIDEIKKQSVRGGNWIARANEMVDLTQSLIDTLNSKDTKLKRSVLTKFGSNLVWNEETLSIINTKEIQTLIDGLKEARERNSRFEPENILDTSAQNVVFEDVRPIMLPRQGSNLRPID